MKLAALLALAATPLFAANETPLDIKSDSSTAQGNVVLATGNVRVTHLDAKIQADRATYDHVAKKLVLEGSVRIQRPGMEHVAEKVTYFLQGQKIQSEGQSKTKLKDQ